MVDRLVYNWFFLLELFEILGHFVSPLLQEDVCFVILHRAIEVHGEDLLGLEVLLSEDVPVVVHTHGVDLQEGVDVLVQMLQDNSLLGNANNPPQHTKPEKLVIV